jgi:hypothetical protein
MMRAPAPLAQEEIVTPEPFIAALEANAPTIAALVRTIPPEQARWRPAPTDWSMLEVINHLADEEREDFRLRLDAALHRPGIAVPPNDSADWPAARAYNERDPAESLARFLDERRQSLAWLRALNAPDWSQAIPRNAGGVLRGGDLLAAWAVHDVLHLRQLVELQYHFLSVQAQPFSIDFAGEW